MSVVLALPGPYAATVLGGMPYGVAHLGSRVVRGARSPCGVAEDTLTS